jgi:hypothetical protein
MATVAAVAHALHDQGYPIPDWMVDYHVVRVPVDRTTPAISVWGRETRTRTERGYLITKPGVSGGAELVTDLNDIVTNSSSGEADAVQTAVIEHMTNPAAVAQTELITAGGEKKHIVAMPGMDAKDLGANVLRHTDLELSLGEGRSFVLARIFNSFFSAEGELGQSWALDVPRLKMEKHLIEKTVAGNRYTVEHYLVWPVGGERIRLGGVSLRSDDRVGSESRVFVPLEKDAHPGEAIQIGDNRVYADDDGKVLAIQDGRQLIIYRWEISGKTRLLKRVEGWIDQECVFYINYQYKNKMLVSAKVNNGDSINYEYSRDGFLKRVWGNGNEVRYSYNGTQVASVEYRAGLMKPLITQYRYGQSGRLIREQRPDGRWISYSVVHDSNGAKIVAKSGSGPGALNEGTEYDSRWRITSKSFADGTQMRWNYGENEAMGDVSLNDGTKYSLRRDDKGRLLSVMGDTGNILRIEWSENDLPLKVEYTDNVLIPRYDHQGRLYSFTMTPTNENNNSLEFNLGENQRKVVLRDDRGNEFQTLTSVDGNGNLQRMDWTGTGGNHWVEISRSSSKQTQTQELKTSWKDSQLVAHRDGKLTKMEFSRAGQNSHIEFANGLPVKLIDFDNGQTIVDYNKRQQVEQITDPSGLLVQYGYDQHGRAENMIVGSMFRVEAEYDSFGRVTRLIQTPMAK